MKHNVNKIILGLDPRGIITYGGFDVVKRQNIYGKNLNNQNLRNGDTCEVEFEFTYYPEFIEKNMIFFFRDGSTKGVGNVIDY